MVEATVSGDGIHRTVQYAVWRGDVEPERGYSRELVSVHAQKNCNWEELQNHAPEIIGDVNTIMKGFLDNVTRQP